MLGEQHLVRRGHVGARNELEDVVGAVSERQRLGRNAMVRRERPFEGKSVAVGIARQPIGTAGHGGERRRTGAQRALVRSKLDDLLESQLPLKLLHGLAGLVGPERPYAFRRQTNEVTTRHRPYPVAERG